MAKLFSEDILSCTAPYAGASLIIDESIMPVRESGETELSIRLMDSIARIVSVTSATKDKTYTEGIDYFLRDGELVLPSGSSIPVMSREEYNPTEGSFDCTLGGKLLFGEGNELHKRQTAVTYEPADDIFKGKYFPTISEKLEGSRKKLKEARLRLAFFGDSITYGCNASGLGSGVPPYMPIYPMLVTEALRAKGYKVDYYNPSIGGKASPWGRERAAYYFAGKKPDLTVIAFGMNDGTMRLAPNDFISNIRSIIETIRAEAPDAEFILAAPTLANPISSYSGLQADYEKPLDELAKREGCAFLDMTELHRTLMTRKEYFHMTGNNINHPSDFLARLYAQGVLALIG